MTLLDRHMLLSLCQVSLELLVDVVDDRLMQRLLVSFQGQDIIRFAIDDRLARSLSASPWRRW